MELLYICPKGIKNIAGSDNEKYSANKVKIQVTFRLQSTIMYTFVSMRMCVRVYVYVCVCFYAISMFSCSYVCM